MFERLKISIHALREEGDSAIHAAVPAAKVFLSTPSARRATSVRLTIRPPSFYFYPRPPRGGRQTAFSNGITAIKFLSTPSARRATSGPPIHEGDHLYFYPRPPRGGRPTSATASTTSCAYFYPRPPRGGRPRHIGIALQLQEFLSTPSARRATLYTGMHRVVLFIFLSTPSARRATRYKPSKVTGLFNFYPRPPRGGRHLRSA